MTARFPGFTTPAARRPPRRTILLALAVVLALLAPGAASAQVSLPQPPYLGPPAGYEAAQTTHFRFFAPASENVDAAAFAVAYGPALEAAYGELAAVLPIPPETYEVAVYPDDAGFAAAAATVRFPDAPLGPVVADPAFGDLAVSLPGLQSRSPLEAEAALRHGLAHLVVNRVSGGRLPPGFAEGFAAYAERPPTARMARAAALVQSARTANRLMTWSDLNRPRPDRSDPDAYNAHAYSLVAFMIDRYGLRQFGEFVTALHDEPDWRAAMRSLYRRAPSEMEAQWQEDLPRWTAGGWRDNVFNAFDLQSARDLLAKGHYAAAQTDLERSLRLFTDLALADRQAEVEPLLRQAETGLQAETLMEQIEQALGRHAYDRAATLLNQAREQYALLPEERRPAALLGQYDALTQSGRQATADLDVASALSASWRDYPAARGAALAAGSAFARLGDDAMYERTIALLRDLDDRQRRMTITLGVLALLSAAWLALWLWTRGPSELDWGP